MMFETLLNQWQGFFFVLPDGKRRMDAMRADEVMRDSLPFLRAGAGRSDAHFTIKLPGICRNDLCTVLLG